MLRKLARIPFWVLIAFGVAVMLVGYSFYFAGVIAVGAVDGANPS